MTATTVFLPWVRHGLAAGIATADPLNAPLAAQVAVRASIDINGTPAASMPVRLAGPGDVAGLDARQVVRCVPPPGSIDFESNNLASVEFDNPDLPWMFTPAAPGAEGRLRPWLVLVVVRRQPGVRLRPPRDEPLPVLEIAAPARPRDELPDLADSWAWAHAQVSTPQGTGERDMAALLAARPELSLSRLVGARLLAANTDYLACVVPAFAAGRRAGLGEAPDGGALLQPAWSSGEDAPTRVTLPVFFHWEFRTGEREDFESMVDKLRPRDLSTVAGRRPMDITSPGFATGDATPNELELEGALQPVDAIRHDWPDATALRWQAALKSIIDATNALAGTTAEDAPSEGPQAEPVVAPPIYGRWHAGRHHLSTTEPTWLDDLNLDPRERVAAALGTRIVQTDQEALVADAWAQAGELRHVNQRLRQMQLSLAVTTRLHARHVERLASDDALWRFVAPARARLVLPPAQPQLPPMTLDRLLAQTATPLAATSAPMRRLARPRGAIARRADVAIRKADIARPRAGPRLVTLNRVSLFAQAQPMVFTLPPTRGLVSFDAISRRLGPAHAGLLYARATDAAVRGTPAQPAFTITAEFAPDLPTRPLGHVLGTGIDLQVTRDPAPTPRRERLRPGEDGGIEPPDVEPPPRPPRPPRPPPRPRIDSADAAAFREAAARHLARVNPAQPPIIVRPLPRPVFDAVVVRTQVSALLEPRALMRRRLESTLVLSQGPLPERIGPMGGAPQFARPLSEPLAALSQDWLLPGLDRVPVDTVALLQPNQRFIDALMVGANVEMARELVWRGFPLADERGTFFRRFWRPGDPLSEGDVEPIAAWSSRRLGAPREGHPSQLVLLLRSRLLQRYPNAVVYAVPAVRDAAGRRPGPPDSEQQPVFRGALQPDVSFFGFAIDAEQAVADPGWYFVIAEQPTEPRFGFDVEIDFAGATHVPLASVPAGMALPPGAQWARNAAHMARITRQQPMRVAIHASELIATPPEPES